MVLLASALLLTRVTELRTAVALLLWQAVMITAACVVSGIEHGEVHLYIAALLTGVIKVGLIPYALLRIVAHLKREREVRPILSPNASAVAAGLAIVLAYALVDQGLPALAGRDVLAAALAITLIGLLLIMTRRQAVLQIVGLMTMENGLYLVGLSITKGLPLVIELGVFFDVLVAVVVLVILTYRLKTSFLSTDTSMLKKLKG